MNHTRRDEPCRYTVQVARPSYPVLRAAHHGGLLIPLVRPAREADDSIKGVTSRATYTLHSDAALEIVHDQEIRLAGRAVRAAVSHLPSWAYSALVRASSGFQQYSGLDDLLAGMRDPTSSPSDIARRLERAVREGRRPDGTPRLVGDPVAALLPTLDGTWRSAETLLHLTAAGHWFLTLVFSPPAVSRAQPRDGTDVGLDLGLDPLSVACHADGQLAYFRPTALVVPAAPLSREATDLLYLVTYASGRLDAEQVIGHLLRHARHVYAERLTHRNVTPCFRHGGRDRALHDFHYAWLPQALNTARRPFTRVNPAFSSQTCARCGHRDARSRRGRSFRCTACGAVADADANAAQVILQRGRQETRHVR